MRRFSVIVLIVLAFSLAMAGGCSKKVSSTPAGTSAAGSSVDAGGLSAEQLEAQRLAELQRQAIDKIGADRIYFDFDRSELTDLSRQILAEKAELLKTHPSLTLLVEGHCDERGTNEYNMALGERRARAAYEYLVLMGIEAGRLAIISYGEEYPAVPGSSEEVWAKNRRDEFKASAN